MSFASSLINEAKKWSDCKEDTGRANRSVCVDKIQLYARGYVSNDPWCAMFVTMVLDKVCKMFGIKNPIGLIAGTHALIAKAKGAGITVDKIPKPGSIMFYDTTKKGSSVTGHVGFVIQVKPDNEIYTIEGNTGDRVGYRTHTVKSNYKFIHVEQLTSAKQLVKNGLNGFSLTSIGIVVASYLLIKYLNK